IQTENPSHGNFLICVLILLYESVQITVLRMTVITGNKAEILGVTPRSSPFYSFNIHQRFFPCCILAVQL
uniref:Uncharacterized protein n=1 Tax=Apteryx owenii TaxID=8824 RepID=A0A8B9PXF7_APTOW